MTTAQTASVTASEVRRRIATRVSAVACSRSLEESKVILGDTTDPGTVADGRFSVVMGRQENKGIQRSRGDGTGVMYVTENIVVRLACAVRPNQLGDQMVDYDRALNDGKEVVSGLMHKDGSWQHGLQIDFVEVAERRRIEGGKFLMTDLAFTVDHLESLA